MFVHLFAFHEPTDCIPQPFPSPSIKPPTPLLPHFTLRPHLFSPTQFSSKSPRMDSNQTVFNTISNFNNSDVEAPDEFLDSEASPTNFSQPPFQPIVSPLPNETSSFPTSYTNAVPILSPMSSNEPNTPRPITDNQLDMKSMN